MNVTSFAMVMMRFREVKKAFDQWPYLLNFETRGDDIIITDETEPSLDRAVRKLCQELRSMRIEPEYGTLYHLSKNEFSIKTVLEAQAWTLLDIKAWKAGLKKGLPQQVSLKISVLEKGKGKYFYLQGLEFFELYFHKLSAGIFDSHKPYGQRNEKDGITIYRNGQVFKKGYAYFQNDRGGEGWEWRLQETGKTDWEKHETLSPAVFEIGDEIEIKSFSHQSIFNFTHWIAHNCGSENLFLRLIKKAGKEVNSIHDLPRGHAFVLKEKR